MRPNQPSNPKRGPMDAPMMPAAPGRRGNIDPNLPFPIFRFGFTVPGNQFLEFDISEGRVLVFAEGTGTGIAAGELSLRFGEIGDDFKLAVGDIIVTGGFRRFRLTNNTGVAKSGAVLVSADPNFRLYSFARGI